MAFVAFFFRLQEVEEEEMRLRGSRELVLVICVVLLAWGAAEAHFGMIIPSDEMVMKFP